MIKVPQMFRFLIREVVFLTVLIAIAACWISDRVRMHFTVQDYESRLHYYIYLLKAQGFPLDAKDEFEFDSSGMMRDSPSLNSPN